MTTGPTVHVGNEAETATGWAYEVQICPSPDAVSSHTVTLSWADHDLISKGLRPPSATVRAALLALLDNAADAFTPDDLPRRFDLATLRRQINGFDDAVRDRLV